MRPPVPPSIHRADVPEHEVGAGDISFRRRRLGAAAGCEAIGCSLYVVAPGLRQMPLHQHGDEEEIFFVLSGSGLSVSGSTACAIGPGDTIAHRTSTDGGAPHTMLAGDEGLEVLSFGTGSETHLTWLPRPKVLWAGPRWVPADGPHPFQAEAAAGPLEVPEPGERPDNVVALEACEAISLPGAEIRRMGVQAGAWRSGLNHARLDDGVTGPPPHCHTHEEELFVVLDGAGTLRLGDREHPLRTGDVVARPPSTGVAHQIRGGTGGLEYLVYGTRARGDTVFYPEQGKVLLRGLGVMLDVPAPGG